MQANAGQCRPMQANAGQCRPMQANAGQCRPMQANAASVSAASRGASPFVNTPRLKPGACIYPARGDAIGRLTAARSVLLMLIAALWSAFIAWRHNGFRQRNSAWLFRLAFSQCPQRLQVRLVFPGASREAGNPAPGALYVDV